MEETRTSAFTEVLSLHELLRVLRHQWLVIVTFVTLALLAAAAYTGLFLDPWYRASTTIRVERPEGEISLFQNTGNSVDRVFLNDQIAILTSSKLWYPVIDELNLSRRLPALMGSDSWPDASTYRFIEREMLEVRENPSSSVLTLAIWAQDPALAAEMANKIAQAYAADRIAFATSGQTEGIRKLQEELAAQAVIVAQKRDGVEALRRELGLAGIDTDMQTASIEVENLRQLERTLTALRVEAMARKTRWEQVAAVPPEERLSIVNAELIADPNLQGRLQAYLDQQQEFARLGNQIGENHPQYVAMQANLRVLQEQLQGLLRGYERSLEIGFREAEARVTAMQEQVAVARVDQIEQASTKLRQFEEAVADMREAETILRSLRLSVRQREIDFQVPKRTIEVLRQAEVPIRAGRPNWTVNLVLAGIVGLLLGTIGAYILEFLDTSFRTVEDVETRLDLPILGVVGKPAVHVTSEIYDSFETEPYRVIQTNLDLAGGDQPARVIAVQSAGPSEGKTTTLYNLGACLALAGHKVLMLDTDFRRPSLHRQAGVSRQPGLVELFNGTSPRAEVIQPTEVSNLEVMTGGQSAAKALTILHGRQLRDLLAELRETYDIILMDSPPVVGISDAAVLARMADGVIVVVQHGRNPQAMTRRAVQILRQVDARLLGVVLNQVPTITGEDYSYYTRNYYYYRADNGAEKSPSNKGAPLKDDLQLKEKV